MARLSQSTVRTVRFYEECGVLQPAQRSEGGHRMFPTPELDKLLFVLDLRAAGLSLEEIKDVLAAKASSDTGAVAAGRVRAVIARHLGAIREKIEALSRLEEDFSRASTMLAGCGECERDPRFPAQCRACDVMAKKELPRAVRVLWGTTQDVDERGP